MKKQEVEREYSPMLQLHELDDDDIEASIERSMEDDPDEILMEPEALPEGIYGMALASLIRDSAHLEDPDNGSCGKCIKAGRLCSSCLMILIALGLQLFLLWSTKTLITPSGVKAIRNLYGHYERHMYDGHVVMNKNNHSRGIDGFFNASNFATLEKDDKELACRIPLSQPIFLFVILLIWTLTVLKHMRNGVNLALRLGCAVPTIENLRDAIQEDGPSHRIVGLTCGQKIGAFVVQFLVFVMNCFLLWLGARWLTSTLGFADLLLNAIALEFILDLPELMYSTVVPKRTQIETQNTMVPHLFTHEPASCWSLFGMYFLFLLGIISVLLYMRVLEQVLPGYKFDVHGVCVDFLAKEMSGGR